MMLVAEVVKRHCLKNLLQIGGWTTDRESLHYYMQACLAPHRAYIKCYTDHIAATKFQTKRPAESPQESPPQ